MKIILDLGDTTLKAFFAEMSEEICNCFENDVSEDGDEVVDLEEAKDIVRKTLSAYWDKLEKKREVIA